MLDVAQATDNQNPRDRLSARELEVLEMASYGLTNRQIAGRLGVTVHAVKFHLAGIYRKLEARNRTEAVVVYLTSARADVTDGV